MKTSRCRFGRTPGVWHVCTSRRSLGMFSLSSQGRVSSTIIPWRFSNAGARLSLCSLTICCPVRVQGHSEQWLRYSHLLCANDRSTSGAPCRAGQNRRLSLALLADTIRIPRDQAHHISGGWCSKMGEDTLGWGPRCWRHTYLMASAQETRTAA